MHIMLIDFVVQMVGDYFCRSVDVIILRYINDNLLHSANVLMR